MAKKSKLKLIKKEIDLLEVLGDVQHDEYVGVAQDALSDSELKMTEDLEVRGYVRQEGDIYSLTQKGKKVI